MTVRWKRLLLIIAFCLLCASQTIAQSETGYWGNEAKSDYGKEKAAKAKAAFERGLVAAQQKAWDVALKYFREAKGDLNCCGLRMPPELLFNLGVVHAGAGNDLLGLAYLHAFLAARPGAPNAEDVRKEFLRLEISNEAKMSTIMKRAVALAENVKDDYARKDVLESLSNKQAETGDIDGARKTRPPQPSYMSPGWAEDQLWKAYGEGLVSAGDIQGALRAAGNIRNDSAKSSVYEKVAYFQREMGDENGAKQTASLITNEIYKANTLLRDARERINQGDFKLAEEILPSYIYPESLLKQIVEQRIASNDLTGARRTADRISEKSKGCGSTSPACGAYRGEALALIAIAQLERNDLTAAQATAREVLTIGPPNDYSDQPFIKKSSASAMLAILGNYDQAITLAKSEPAADLERVLYIMILKGDVQRATALADSLHWDKSPYEATAQIARGQLAEALKTLQSSPTTFDGARIFELQLQLGDIAGAEATLKKGGVSPDRLTPDSVTRLAAAYEKKGLVEEAKRALRDMSKIAGERKPYWGADLVIKYKLLKTISETQTRLGDVEGEKLTRSQQPDPGSYHGVAEWMDLIAMLERNVAVADLDSALKKAGENRSERGIIDAVADIALQLRNQMNAILTLSRRFPVKPRIIA